MGMVIGKENNTVLLTRLYRYQLLQHQPLMPQWSDKKLITDKLKPATEISVRRLTVIKEKGGKNKAKLKTLQQNNVANKLTDHR